MDLAPKMFHKFPTSVPLPFYMTYPGYQGGAQERALVQDMEYLQQVYPNEVKRYQRRVAEILDKMDYEGSMIYDEYPDYGSLRRMVESIIKILQNEEKELPEKQGTQEEGSVQEEGSLPLEKWKWLEGLIQVLLCDEIYKRRHGGRRGRIFG
ncbi:MAG: hypothetical protein NC092_12320 [Butyrivibrio sp.]|nr:hypothetical protein [Muribaculum sp.]MCM1553462.1 hypothetical protein [Butyrivibrio sp.]